LADSRVNMFLENTFSKNKQTNKPWFHVYSCHVFLLLFMNYNKQKNNQVYSLVVSCFFVLLFSLSLLLYIWMMEFYKWWIQNYDEKKSWIPISSTLFRVIQLTWSRSHTQKTQSHLHRSLDIQKCLFTVLSLYLFYLIKKEKKTVS